MEGKEKHVVVMYVPELTSDKMRDFILDACTKAFDFASSRKLSLALPVQLSDVSQVETFKTMLHAICKHMEREDTFKDVVLYISDTSQLKTLMDISSKYLMRCGRWYTDVIFRESRKCLSSSMNIVEYPMYMYPEIWNDKVSLRLNLYIALSPIPFNTAPSSPHPPTLHFPVSASLHTCRLNMPSHRQIMGLSCNACTEKLVW